MSPRAPAAAAAALLLLAGTARPGGAAPALRFDAPACALGSLVQGERPSCEFTFRNRGDAPLEITGVEPECGCTTALPAARRVAPGAAGSLRVVFDSSNFVGDVEKRVVVRSNDPEAGEQAVTVTAHVEAEVEFEPREVVFDAPEPGRAVAETVVLVNRRAEPVLLRSVAAEPSSYRCRVRAAEAAPGPLRVESWERVPVEVTYAPAAAAVMPVAGRCTLVIEGPRLREFTLKLLALPR